MNRNNNWVRRGSSRLYVPRGYVEGEAWAARGLWVERRYFSFMVNSARFGTTTPPNTYYLVTTAGGGGDGSLGSPWNTLESARAGIIALFSSLVTSTVNPVLICSGATDDTTATTNTWPTSSTTYYLTIKVPDADRKCEWDASVYTYARSAAGAILSIGTNSIRLQGLQIYQQGNASSFDRPLDISSLGGEFVADGVKLRGNAGFSGNSCGFKTSGTSGRFVFRNCMSIDSRHGILCGNPTGLGSNSEVDLYNCTVVGATGGGEAYQQIFAAGSGRIARRKNCISRQITNAGAITNADTSDTATNSHSSSGVGTTDFVDPTNKDLRLKAGGGYQDIGTDLSGVADFPFSIDASLYTRPYNGTWDPGFHEYRP